VVLVGLEPLFNATDSSEGLEGAFDAFFETLQVLRDEPVQIVMRARAGVRQISRFRSQRMLLKSLSPRVAVELGLPSLNPKHCDMLEGPGGEAPADRLRFAEILSAWEIPVRVRIDPLLPMLTDQKNVLDKFFNALARVGVARVAIRYLVLTPQRAKVLSPRLNRLHREMMKACFAESAWQKPTKGLSVYDGAQPFKRLPDAIRSSGHQRVLNAASRVGVIVDIMDPVDLGKDVKRSQPGVRRASKMRAAQRMVSGQTNEQMELFGQKRA
jgi:DNA repair photolyase